MRHDPPRGSETDAEWQAAHEPMLTLKAWLMNNNAVMINVTWSGDTQPTPTQPQPLRDMRAVLIQVHGVVDDLASAVVEATRQPERPAMTAGVKEP
jgi:hypothetical protein